MPQRLPPGGRYNWKCGYCETEYYSHCLASDCEEMCLVADGIEQGSIADAERSADAAEMGDDSRLLADGRMVAGDVNPAEPPQVDYVDCLADAIGQMSGTPEVRERVSKCLAGSRELVDVLKKQVQTAKDVIRLQEQRIDRLGGESRIDADLGRAMDKVVP